MNDERFDVPVLFLIFNQPEITIKTFQEIRRVRPKKIFISADGPREGREGETQECIATRQLVLDSIDWQCELRTRFLDKNIGCKRAVSSGISWFFDQVEEGIILEYDCVPSQSFFWFCQELLEKFRYDERVMTISGSNHQMGKVRGDASYYFSKIPSAWGWATWRRAWKSWDGDLLTYPEFKKEKKLRDIFQNKRVVNYWDMKFEQVFNNIDGTWGYPWVYGVFCQNGICATSNVNLITNVGFSENATNAIDRNNCYANMQRSEIIKITHPKFLVADIEADEFFSMKLAYLKPKERIEMLFKSIALKFLSKEVYSMLKKIYLKIKNKGR